VWLNSVSFPDAICRYYWSVDRHMATE